MRDYAVAAGESKVIDLFIVLDESDTFSLKQETTNAINVALKSGKYKKDFCPYLS